MFSPMTPRSYAWPFFGLVLRFPVLFLLFFFYVYDLMFLFFFVFFTPIGLFYVIYVLLTLSIDTRSPIRLCVIAMSCL